jgi:hypothetical protein
MEYSWDVGESLSGPFKPIPGKSTASITVTREEMESLGFGDPYGRKYFRVTGLTGTTSQLQAIDVPYPAPTASLTVAPPRCHGEKNGSVKVDIASADPSVINDFVITVFSDAALQLPVDQKSVDDGFTTTIINLAAGTYWLKIENNSNPGLYGSCPIVYAVPPLTDPPEVKITGFDVSDFNGFGTRCSGSRDGSIVVRSAGGTGLFPEYEWAPPVAINSHPTNLVAGTYTVRAKDSNNCSSTPVSIDLRAPEQLTLKLKSAGGKNGFDVSCLGKMDGKIGTDVAGGVGQYHYTWSDGTTGATLINATASEYTLKVTDGNGCATTGSLTLTAPKIIDFTIAEIAGIHCPGDRSGILEVQSTVNTIGQVYYAWSSGEHTQEISDKSSGTYSVTLSDDQGCTRSKDHLLIEPEPWSLEISAISNYNGMPIRCNGDANGRLKMTVRDEDRNPVDAQRYTWYRNGAAWASGPSTSTVDNLPEGTYRGVVTYKDFCTLEQTITVDQPPLLAAAITVTNDYNGSPISCSGNTDGHIRSSATGGTGDRYAFLWNGGITGPDLDGIGAGTYSVTVSDINGCLAHAEISLDQPDPLKPTIAILSDYNGQAISCAGAQDARLKASAKGGRSPITYVWNTETTGPELFDVGPGFYRLTATDLNGCQASADTTLTAPEPVKAVIADRSDYNAFGVTCNGGENGYLLGSAKGGTGFYHFLWDGHHSKALYENLHAGTYTLRVMDENGCASVAESTITEPPPLSLHVASATAVACNKGADGEIELEAEGGAGQYRFAADDGPWQQAAAFSGLHAGLHSFQIMDVNLCVQKVTQTLLEPPPLSCSFDRVTSALCGDATGWISAVITGGTPPYAYQWTDTNNNVLSGQAGVSGLPSGVYTLTVTDDHLCEVRQSVGVPSTDGPSVTVSAVSAATCSYTADGEAQLVIDGTGPFVIRWPDGQDTTTVKELRRGDYFVQITDANLCTTVQKVTIPAPDSLRVELLEETEPDCTGDCNGKLVVTARGGGGNYLYNWDNQGGGPELTGLCAGQFSVTVSDDHQCTSSQKFTLHEPDSVVIRLKQLLDPTCPDGCDGKLLVTGSGGTGKLVYQWRDGQSTDSISGLCAGSYNVTVTDMMGCMRQGTFDLENPQRTPLDLGGPITLCSGQTHTLDAGPSWEKYAWSGNMGFRSTSRRVTIQDAGLYSLEATSSNGCVSRDTFDLRTSTDLLHANFLMSTEAMATDTVVIIDISWPLPEQLTWNFPDEMKRVEDSGDRIYGQFENPGTFDITLTATLRECHDRMTKTITVIGEEETSGNGRLREESLVKAFSLFPNPNEGSFDVQVAYGKPNPVVLTMSNLLTARKIAEVRDFGKTDYLVHFDLRPLSAGMYDVCLDTGNGTRHLRFIVR